MKILGSIALEGSTFSLFWSYRVQTLHFHLRTFILAQEVDRSLWFLILAAPGTLPRTLSALLVSQHGSSQANWSDTQAETVVKSLFYISTSSVESSATSG